jgi:anaerobic magnesium-protoporphyrin IX monomethyl ester cyclase
MVTSRGCPFHCNWCAKPIWGQRYHARSPEDVAAEMRWLYDHYRPDHLWFMDDMMGIKPGWLARLADLVAENGVRIPFKCLNRADLLLREGEIDALRRAGCRTVWMGVESGSQAILDAMDKGITVEQVREATRRLHEAGVAVGFFLQFGYPGETRDDIARTFRLVREGRPDQIGVSVSYPLPGTPFYDAVKAQLGARQNWVDSDDLAMLYRGPFTTAFYRMLHRVLHKEFRARKAWDHLRGAVRHPARLRRKHLREAAVMAYHTATLPLARLRMERLARVPHEGVEPLPPLMTTTEAATPSPF